jgi:segregation and condensation protein B
MDPELVKQVEAILFSCGRKIEPEEISQILGKAPGIVREALASIKAEYEKMDSALILVEEGTAWKMTVRERYIADVRKITPYMEFPKSVMETLAVVAWKQPILQSDVIKIRTNKAYDHIVELEKLGFLAKEKHGRSFLLKLSQKFYDYFDLRSDVDVQNLFKGIREEPKVQTTLLDPNSSGTDSKEAEAIGKPTKTTPESKEEPKEA